MDVTAKSTVQVVGANGEGIAELTLFDSANIASLFYVATSDSCIGVCGLAGADYQYSPDFDLAGLAVSVPINQTIGVAYKTYAFLDGGTTQVTATLDPVLSLDAANPTGLTLELSPGIQQPSGVLPEPSDFALFGLGLTALLGATRRRDMRPASNRLHFHSTA